MFGKELCKNHKQTIPFVQGDSGGPLYLKHIIKGKKVSAVHSTDSKEPWYLLGIVSFGTQGTCGVGKPAIYTR